MGITYNSLTTTQSVTFSVTGPTPTPTPAGVEQISIDYGYDPLYRLTRATYAGSFARTYYYSYDAVGNRLTQTANGVRTTYSYDNANRLTSVNGQPYTWDNNGNLVSDGLLTYSYDQANRLKQVTQGANTYTFAYNGVGDRLSQTVGVTTTRYVLDPAAGSGQAPGAGLTQVLADGTNAYLYGNARVGQYQASMQYFGADGLGSVRQLYDATGQVIATNRYDPYGNVISQSGMATSIFRFTGEQWDAATGLEYLRARYYSSAQGRFTTRDVWEGDPNAPMSYNAWLYAYASPANRIDPSGHCDPDECAYQQNYRGTWYTQNTGTEVMGRSALVPGGTIDLDHWALSRKNLPNAIMRTQSTWLLGSSPNSYWGTFMVHGTRSAHSNYLFGPPSYADVPATIWSLGGLGGACENFFGHGVDFVLNWRSNEFGVFEWDARSPNGFLTPQIGVSAQQAYAWNMDRLSDYGGKFDVFTGGALIFTGEGFASQDRKVKGFGAGVALSPLPSIGSYTADYFEKKSVKVDPLILDLFSQLFPVKWGQKPFWMP